MTQALPSSRIYLFITRSFIHEAIYVDQIFIDTNMLKFSLRANPLLKKVVVFFLIAIPSTFLNKFIDIQLIFCYILSIHVKDLFHVIRFVRCFMFYPKHVYWYIIIYNIKYFKYITNYRNIN